MLALSPDEARNAVNAAISAILSRFARVAATPHGARILSGAADQAFRDGVSSIDAGTPSVPVEDGLEVLRSLLGKRNLEALVSALETFSGVNGRGASLLLGTVGPMILAYLGKQQVGSDALANLLSEQKGTIMAAMPAGLRQPTRPGSFPEGIAVMPRGSPVAFGDPVHTTGFAVEALAVAAGRTDSRAERGLSLIQGMGLLVAGVLVVGVSQFIFGGHMHTAMQPTAEIVQQAAPPSASLVVGKVDLGNEFSGEIARVGQILAGVTDIASAKAALPALQTIADSLEKLKEPAGHLPAFGQVRIADLAARAMPLLQAKFNKACAIPGVAEVLNPVLDPLMASIGNLAKRFT